MKAMISRARQNNYLPSMKLCDRVRESDSLSVRLSASKSWWYYSGFTGMLSILWHCWLGGIRSVTIWLLWYAVGTETGAVTFQLICMHFVIPDVPPSSYLSVMKTRMDQMNLWSCTRKTVDFPGFFIVGGTAEQVATGQLTRMKLNWLVRVWQGIKNNFWQHSWSQSDYSPESGS